MNAFFKALFILEINNLLYLAFDKGSYHHLAAKSDKSHFYAQ